MAILKKKFAILFIALSAIIISNKLLAQTPNFINYQAVVRDGAGELITNQSIDARISIIDNTADGTVLYTESHTVTTSNNGLVNFLIGDGTVEQGLFTSIDWAVNNKFLQIEINTGSGFADLGTVQLLSVPYAFYAKDVENKDDADASVTNEIQDISLTGTDLSISSGSTVDLSVLQDGTADADSDPTNEFQSINLDGDTLSISDGNRIVFPYDSSRWAVSGDKLYYNTGNVGIGSSNPVSNLEVKANTVGTEALFQVINANNDTVFAVYPDGVKIFVDASAKGKVGGFAVSGRNPSKSGEVDILRVTIDSTRIYVNDTASAKGKVGGFAVSGRNPSKSGSKDILFVTGDSTRIYINENTGTKGKVGGFAVSGRNPSKGTLQPMFVSTVDSTRIYTQDTIGGFSVKNNNSGTTTSYMKLTPLNYFIGHESGELVTQNPLFPDRGKYNTFFGYNAGKSNTYGYNNIFMGYRSGYSNSDGSDNIFLGINAGYYNVNSSDNIFIGNYAGYNTEADDPTFGSENVFIGSNSGYSNLEGYDNVYIGNKSGEDNLNGRGNVFIGGYAGNSNLTSDNTIIGGAALYQNTSGTKNTVLGAYAGTYNITGQSNVFIGYQAGYNETGSYRLYIDNSSTTSPLIYGEFDNNRLSFNGNVGVNRAAYASVSLAVSPNSQNYGIYVDAGSAVYAGYFIGSVYATGTFSSSDIRFKRDVEPIMNPIDKIKGIRGVNYYWDTEQFGDRGFTDEKQLGVIAQEVEKVLPELVHDDEDGYKSVSYDKLTAVLVEAIKEQQSQIENLEAKNKNVEELQTQVDVLKAENEMLKQKLNEILEMLEK